MIYSIRIGNRSFDFELLTDDEKHALLLSTRLASEAPDDARTAVVVIPRLLRLLLGEPTSKARVLADRVVDVQLPEGVYRWVATVVMVETHRPRWPFSTTYYAANCAACVGEEIPMNGGEVCTDRFELPFASPHSAFRFIAARLVNRMMEQRAKRGWPGVAQAHAEKKRKEAACAPTN